MKMLNTNKTYCWIHSVYIVTLVKFAYYLPLLCDVDNNTDKCKKYSCFVLSKCFDINNNAMECLNQIAHATSHRSSITTYWTFMKRFIYIHKMIVGIGK